MYRTFRTPSLWREMDRLQRDMNRLFNSYFPSQLQAASSYPAINIWTHEDGLVLSAEMPGVQVKDIDIQVNGNTPDTTQWGDTISPARNKIRNPPTAVAI